MKTIKSILPILIIIILIFSNCTGSRFTIKERRVIRNIEPDKIMPIMYVYNQKDSIILYKISKEVKPDTTNKKLIKLINGMYTTVNDPQNMGVGIAAPQVGVNKQIIWVQRFDKENSPFEFYLNSKIIYYSKTKSKNIEVCLSIPNFTGTVNRSDTIIIKYDLINSKSITDTVNGFTAIIFQHEIDHLNGKLFTDRMKKEEEK